MDAPVVNAYYLEVDCVASEGGVMLQAVRGEKIERPLPKAKKKRGVEEATGGESVEDLGMGADSSDLQSSCAVVDTAKEDTPAGDSSSQSGSDREDLKKPRKGGEPATGEGTATGGGTATGEGTATGGGTATGEGAATGDRTATGDGPAPGSHRRQRPPIYDNDYFYIADNTGNSDVKMYIHKEWIHPPPLGMGREPTMSKTLTPARYGETRENPERSYFLLRAWMVWRARLHGFAAFDAARDRFFKDEALRLERDVRSFQPQTDGLLGNLEATSLFMEWVPDVAVKARVL